MHPRSPTPHPIQYQSCLPRIQHRQAELLSSAAGVEHAVVEGGDAVRGDALRDEPRPGLVRPRLHQDARGDVVQVGERHDVRGRAPAVVHLREAEARPVGHQQRAVVGRDLVRVDAGGAGLARRPPRELRGHPPLAVLDDPHHLRHRGARHLPRGRRHAHDVVAVAVEPGASARERAVQRGPRVHGEADVDEGVRLEPRRAGAAPPRLGDEHLERGAPPGARRVRRAVLRLVVPDVVGGDVHGEVRQPPGAGVGGREPPHQRRRRVRDRVAAPLRLHRHRAGAGASGAGAGQLPDRGHELRGARAVGDGVAEAEAHDEAAAREGGDLDEQDQRALVLGGRGGREEVVLGHHQRGLQVVHVLERARGLGLREPHAGVAAVHGLLRAGLRQDQAARQRVVVDQCAGEGALDGPGRAASGGGRPVGGRLEDVERLDQRHLRGVPVQPGEAERAGWRGLGRDHPARRQPLDGLGRRRHGWVGRSRGGDGVV
uniref:Uncharacterized protein n=1 Tax=Zea mays TaxID=4577 RepID=A0A804QKU8_MAIZE